ncbi:MAG: MFS transporter [Pseudomonadota bacterium]
MRQKPALNFWQIWNMCFGFLGIQFGFALQNANVSRIFQTLGAEIDELPILWIAAPVTGLIVQPIIGFMSDRTWNSLGRRRPYFLYGALAATAALFFMPNSPTLWVAAGMLWILDASINVSMEPFRAFVGDMLPHRQRTLGFAMQSFFIGIGAIVASALPWMLANWFDVANTAPDGIVPDSVKISFYAGGVVLFLAVGWTVLRTREYPPEELAAFADAEPPMVSEEVTEELATPAKFNARALIWLAAGAAITALVFFAGLDKQIYILGIGSVVFGLLLLLTARQGRQGRIDAPLYEIMSDLFQMPRVMKQLAVVQFFSWFALFSMWIYTTAAVTSFHYGTSDTTSAAYNDGADWVGVLFAAYNGFAALAAFFIPWLARVTNRRVAHLINLWIGGAALASFVFIKDPQWLLLSMVGVGIAWASILSLPYAMLSGALPSNKMGVYMGIFNFFIVIPQLLAATVIGSVVSGVFQDQAIYALVLGGVFFFVGGIATLFVSDHDPHEVAESGSEPV